MKRRKIQQEEEEGASLCAASKNVISSETCILHVLQCLHDVDVHHIFCLDLDLHLTCIKRPTSNKDVPFQQISMCILIYRHDVYAHVLFCFDLDLHLTYSLTYLFYII